MNAFQNVDASLPRRAAASFEGEESERLARRKLNWIADVEIQAGSD